MSKARIYSTCYFGQGWIEDVRPPLEITKLLEQRLQEAGAPDGEYRCTSINNWQAVKGTADYEGLNPNWVEEKLPEELTFARWGDKTTKVVVSSSGIRAWAFGAEYPDHGTDGIYSNYGVSWRFQLKEKN